MHLKSKKRSTCLLLVCLLLFVGPPLGAFADTEWQVKRSTQSLELDTVRQLVAKQKFREALEYCETQIGQYPASSFHAAKWAVEHSQVLVAMASEEQIFDEIAANQSTGPIVALLESYPEHDYRLFLEAGIYHAKKQAVLHLVSRSVISPLNEELNREALRFSVKVSDSITDFVGEIKRYRSQISGQAALTSMPSPEELYRLQQGLMVDVVSLALIQTSLIDSNSSDFIAAATTTEKIANDALAVLPNGTEARREVLRLRLEALMRMKQSARAAEILSELDEPYELGASPKWKALRVRMHIEQNQELAARDTLVDFYGIPLERMILQPGLLGEIAIEMDLSLLQFFLHYGTTQRVADCLDWIEQRGGRYARLRADAIALEKIIGEGKNPALQKNPKLIAARGEQLIRNGNLSEAAELLALASSLAAVADEGVQYGVQAAAAFQSLENAARAAEVLRMASVKHAKSKQASSVHLQSAILFSQVNTSKLDDLQSRLREHLAIWPQSQTTRSVSLWLYKILREKLQLVEAADVLNVLLQGEGQPSDEGLLSQAWYEALSQDSVDWLSVSDSFSLQVQSNPSPDHLSDTRQKLALILLDATKLKTLEINHFGEFEKAIYNLRLGQHHQENLPNPPEGWTDYYWLKALTLRILQDANHQKDLRLSVARSLLDWRGVKLEVPQRAECLLWLQQFEEAIESLEAWMTQSPNSLDCRIISAKLLVASENQVAVLKGASIWNAISQGMKKGTDIWHESKIERIKALKKAGDEESAHKLVRYLLLTTPDLSEFWKSKYEEQLK